MTEHRNTDKLIDKDLEQKIEDMYNSNKSLKDWVYCCTWDEQDSINTEGQRTGMLCHIVVGYNEDVRWLITCLDHFVKQLDTIASGLSLDKPEEIKFDDDETISWIQYINLAPEPA
jgi:hypothetical protein